MLQALEMGVCAILNTWVFYWNKDGVLYRTSLSGGWEDAEVKAEKPELVS